MLKIGQLTRNHTSTTLTGLVAATGPVSVVDDLPGATKTCKLNR